MGFGVLLASRFPLQFSVWPANENKSRQVRKCKKPFVTVFFVTYERARQKNRSISFSFLIGLYTEGNWRFKIDYAYIARELCVSKSSGLAYSWKEIYVSNLQEVFTETRLEDAHISKTQPCKYFVCIDRGNSSQDWRVN